MSLIGKPLKYLNEGNAHVVLSIANTEYVIRLIKEDQSETDLEYVSHSISFVNSVMIPLISSRIAYKEEIITIPYEDITEISHNILQLRPKHRQTKSKFSQYAIQAPNLTMIALNCESYCLEIKPKEGFMSNNFKKYSKCYYCLKQLLKLQEKQTDHISEYCPLDLFSGVKSRMKSAIRRLIENPQNNLKLFKDGNIIYNEKSNIQKFETLLPKSIFSSLNLFLEFITEILLGNGYNNIILNESNEFSTKFEKCCEGKNLNANSFLYNLLSLQKLSENFNLESQYTDSEGNFDYVSEILRDLKELNFNMLNDREKFLASTNPTHLALISAIAKDCSIMICFLQGSYESYPYVEIDGQIVGYRISVTDLEPKSIKTLSKRKKTEQKLISLHEKTLKK